MTRGYAQVLRYFFNVTRHYAMKLFSMSRLTSATLSAALFSASAVHAAGVAQLNAFATQVKSAKGEFVQRQVSGQGDAVKVKATSQGTFVFARPGKFIWQYTKPYEQVLQSDGTKLYIWDKDLNQVTAKKLGNALASSPAAILFGSNDLSKHFVIKDGALKQGIDWVSLTPRSKDSQFNQIGIGFKNGQLEAMELQDAFGNTTLLTFSNLTKNPKLNAQSFQFKVPAKADMIKE